MFRPERSKQAAQRPGVQRDAPTRMVIATPGGRFRTVTKARIAEDSGMPDFVSGIVLARQFYREAVRPILDEALPGLAHAAGLIGFGSEVLGFDTPVSVDHHWGPRVLLFLGDEDC